MSSVYSREIIYPLINVIHMGKIIVTKFLTTCSKRNWKSHTIPSSAIVVNKVSKTVRSIRETPIQIIKYLFNFTNSVFMIVTISLTPFLVKTDCQKKGNSSNCAQGYNQLRRGRNQLHLNKLLQILCVADCNTR